MAYKKLHVAAGGCVTGHKRELTNDACVHSCVQRDLLKAEIFGFNGTSVDVKTSFYSCQNGGLSLCLDHTPKTRANPMWCHTTSLFLWIHVSSFTTCSAAPLSYYPPLSTHLNPIQSNSGIQPATALQPSPSSPVFTSCWQIRPHDPGLPPASPFNSTHPLRTSLFCHNVLTQHAPVPPLTHPLSLPPPTVCSLIV